MKKALVCGAGGFIGGHLVKWLKKEGYWVRGVDIKEHEFAFTAADEFLLLDLREEQNCQTALALNGGTFDEVYQLQGGILNYLENVPDSENQWQGECFVFDKRVAVDRDLAEREVRLAVGEIAPDEDHRRAGRGGQDDQPGDIGVDLRGRQVGLEKMADEEPGQEGQHLCSCDHVISSQKCPSPKPSNCRHRHAGPCP